MTHIYDVHAYKGGVGVTTTACALAMCLAAHGERTLLLNGTGHRSDITAWLGISHAGSDDGPPVEVAENLLVGEYTTDINTDGIDEIVVDSGRNVRFYNYDDILTRVCVVRNDYMTLRATARNYNSADEVLVMFEVSNSVLTINDVSATLGRYPIRLVISDLFQRAIDAGMTMSSSRSKLASSWARDIINEAFKIKSA